MEIRSSKNRRSGRRRVQLICEDPSLTEQAHQESCDINNILKRVTPEMIHGIIDNPGQYGDFSNCGSFQESLDKINESKELFLALDPAIRKRFRNNPMELVEFLDDESNHDEAVRLGIVVEPLTEPVPAPPVEETPPAAPEPIPVAP